MQYSVYTGLHDSPYELLITHVPFNIFLFPWIILRILKRMKTFWTPLYPFLTSAVSRVRLGFTDSPAVQKSLEAPNWLDDCE